MDSTKLYRIVGGIVLAALAVSFLIPVLEISNKFYTGRDHAYIWMNTFAFVRSNFTEDPAHFVFLPLVILSGILFLAGGIFSLLGQKRFAIVGASLLFGAALYTFLVVGSQADNYLYVLTTTTEVTDLISQSSLTMDTIIFGTGTSIVMLIGILLDK